MKKWVEEAVSMAMLSPCQSKRGAVIWKDDGRLISAGFNHQPRPFACDGSDRCNKNCGKTAVHAEQSALLAASVMPIGASMLHVKARDRKPCASMAPSCLECSKLILASGISWMYLVHDPRGQQLPGGQFAARVEGFQSDGHLGELHVRRYSAVSFHYLTAEWYHRIPLIRDEASKPLLNFNYGSNANSDV